MRPWRPRRDCEGQMIRPLRPLEVEIRPLRPHCDRRGHDKAA
jgi:hypothetical protein